MTFMSTEPAEPTARLKIILAAAVVASAAVVGSLTVFQSANSVATEASSSVAAPVATKGDRLDSKLPSVCQGQPWGEWTPDCVSAITGKPATRAVRTIT